MDVGRGDSRTLYGVTTTESAISAFSETSSESQRLLDSYIRTNNHGAFAELVSKYIDFVHGTACRSLGGDRALADDVTQAVFVIFSKKAHTIHSASAIGSWLHQTTLYACSNARKINARRQHHEQQAANTKPEAAMPDDNLESVSPLLDQAISTLNSTDKAAIIGRYFQGTTTEQLARDLNTNPEAIQKRLERAVEKLRNFFTRNKLSASAVGVTTLLSASSTHAAPATLATAIVSTTFTTAATGTTVAAITKGTLFMMKMIQLKFVALISICTLAAGTIGITVAQQISNSTRPAATTQASDSIQGKWEIIDAVKQGQLAEPGEMKKELVSIDETTIQVGLSSSDKANYQLNPTTNPKQIDLSDNTGKKIAGIYELNDDLLKICFNKKGGARPGNFELQIGNDSITYLELKRYVVAAADDQKAFLGDWEVVTIGKGGKLAPPEQLSDAKFNFTDTLMSITIAGETKESGNYVIDPTTSPKQFDLRDKDNPDRLIPGIYELNGDTLKISCDPRTAKRPAMMPEDPSKTTGVMYILKRAVKPIDADAKVQGMKNLRQIGLALRMYSLDNRGSLPASLSDLTKSYLTPDVLLSPIPDSKEAYVYLGNDQISTGRVAKLAATTIISFDKTPTPENGSPALFMDGHVEWLTKEELTKQLEQSKTNLETARTK